MIPRVPRRIVAGMAAGLLLSCLPAQAQDERCGAGRDLVVQALERITPSSGDDAFEDALQLLKHAVSTCSELGDAWYYRSLVERRLGHASLAQYSLNKAQLFGSEAMREGLNPLVLATPPAKRGLTAEAAPAPNQPQPASPASPPAAVAPGPVQQKWALVVGISQFSDHAVPALHYTTADADAFADELKDGSIGRFPPDNVHVLTDTQATTRNIKEQLNWIARHAQPNDLVVIYVATHGSPRELDSAGGANYIVTYDTEIKSADKPDEDALYATALPMVELANAVATRMQALRTAVILDTCYSGGAITGNTTRMGAGLANAAPSSAMLNRMSEGTGRIIIAASSSNEESLESTELRHGYFTWYLLQALKSGNGMTPLSEVYADVAREVAERVAAEGQKAGEQLGQHPVMSRSSADADFALGVSSGGASKGGR
ncbi:MAG TPA: caspase family protein [Acidobacteriaceae bacterium]|nr:caspase family protein [Acidobacteriaceae bacterium]